MKKILKKSILILLLIILCFSTTSFAKKDEGWTYSDVQYDNNGIPYVIGTDKNGNEHKLPWDSENNKFKAFESSSSGTEYQGGATYYHEITYDELAEEKKGTQNFPTSAQLNNSRADAEQKAQEEAKKRQEESQKASARDQKAIEKSKDPSASDVATGKNPNSQVTNSYYMMKIDGEWVIVMHYGNFGGNDIVLHWDGTRFYGDNSSTSNVPTIGNISYEQAETMFRDDFNNRGMTFPSRNELSGNPDQINPSVNSANHQMTNVVLMIRQAIALWYFVFRYICVALMLIVLLILGIKIAVSSVGEKKAKYKKMMVDWFVGCIILFSIHYIMIGIVLLNQAGIDLIKDTANRVYSQDQRVYIVEDPSEYGAKRYQEKTTQDLEVSLYETVRTRAYDAKLTNGCIGMVFYACLVYFAYKFTFVYLKRILNIAILTIMSPLVAVSYSLNRILTGKASIFSKWFKEYFTLVMIQFFHALVYVTFVMGTLKIALSSLTGVLFALILLKYMSDSEKIIRKIFGMDSNAMQDLAGTMQQGPNEYYEKLKAGAGIIIGAGAAGKMNRFLNKSVAWLGKRPVENAFRNRVLKQAEKDIRDRDNIEDENLKNSPTDRDYVDEVLDYDEEAEDLTEEQQEMKDIVESEKYLDAQENEEEYTGGVPKYKSRLELNLAKQKLANNPKVILAAARQRLHNAFDFRTYTERYVEKGSDGKYHVGVRLKSDENNLIKKRHKYYIELVEKQFSLKNIIGYTDEDAQEVKKETGNIVRTAGGFLGSVIAMGSAPDLGLFSMFAFLKGSLNFQAGINLLSEDNIVKDLPDFEDNPMLSIAEIDALRANISDELITKRDSYIVNSIARKHRRLARALARPYEVGLRVTSFPAGRLYRDVSRLRWEYLRFDLTEEKNVLVKRRLEIIERISNLNRDEQENVDVAIDINKNISNLRGTTTGMTPQQRSEKIKEYQKQLKGIEKRIIKIDKELRENKKKQAKFETDISKIEQDKGVEEFKEKVGHIRRSGGIGYAKREYVVDSTLKALKEADKEIRKEKMALLKKLEADAKKEREAKNAKPINQFLYKGLKKGVLHKAFSANPITQEDGTQETEEEEIIVPVYDLKDSIRVTADTGTETDIPSEGNREQVVDEVFKQWEINYKEAQKAREAQATKDGKIAVGSNLKSPNLSELPAAPLDIKITLEDVRVAIIKSAARKNLTVRKYVLTTGNTNEIKKVLFGMVKNIYLIDGDLPTDVVNYINRLDPVITYAKSTLVANEFATSAISEQIEEKGKDGVNVNEAVEKVKESLKEYFEEVHNMLLPPDMQRHDYIEEDTIVEEAGFDTIQGLAEKTMDKKLESMATLIRARNVEDGGSVSPETEQVVSELREKMKKVFKGESLEEQNKRQDDILRMFHSDKSPEEGKKEVFGMTPGDVVDDVDDEAIANLLEELDNTPQEREPELIEESVIAGIEGKEKNKAELKERPWLKGIPFDNSGESDSAGSDSSFDNSGESDSAGSDEIGAQLDDALAQVESNSESESTLEGSPIEASTEQEPTSNSDIEDLIAGIVGSQEETNPDGYEPQAEDSISSEYGSFDGQDSANQQQPVSGNTTQTSNNNNSSTSSSVNTEAYTQRQGNIPQAEPSQSVNGDSTQTYVGPTEQSERDFFKNRNSQSGATTETSSISQNDEATSTQNVKTEQQSKNSASGNVAKAASQNNKKNGSKVIREDGSVQHSEADGSLEFVPVEGGKDNPNKNKKGVQERKNSEHLPPTEDNGQQ